VITSSLVFDHLEDLNSVFGECIRVLKPGGTLILAITNPLLYQESSLVGKANDMGEVRVFGEYFKRRKITRTWGGTATMTHYHRPLEDYFSAFLDAGFELVAFREPSPAVGTSSWHEKNPVFLVFKLRKK